jgi:glycosyltransferase involved in cell wall biosynthesis
MRIAFTVHKFPPESLGGTEIYSWSLARQLAADGHEVYVFYPLAGAPDGERQVVRHGVHLWRVPVPESRAREGVLRQYWHTFRDAAIESAFRSFLAEVDPAIVHFQHVQGVSARLIDLAGPLPRLLTLHDYWFFCANSQLIRPDHTPCNGPSFGCMNCVDCATDRADLLPLRRLRPLVAMPFAYRNRYLRRMIEQIDLFIAPSEFLRQQYISHGIPAHDIIVLENGQDPARLAPKKERSWPEPPGRPHFGFLGSLAWQKGVHVLVEAFNQLPAEAALTIYGGEPFPEYAAEVKAMARHPNIHFAGPVSYEQVGDALSQIDCLVVPSLWYENSPLVIQEAYGAGVPVVASNLGALPEKVRAGETGLLFTPGAVDELAQVLGALIEHPEVLASLGKNVQPAPTMAQHARQLVELYRELATSSNLSSRTGRR